MILLNFKLNFHVIDFGMYSLDRSEIESLERKFEKIYRQLDEDINLDETIYDLENYSKQSLRILKAFESDVITLKEQVMQLDALNRTLKAECYANTIFIPEL